MDNLFTPLRQHSTTPPLPTPTTDYTVIESQKENIRPLASGRSAATLGALFSTKDVEAERVVREGHERYKSLIEDAERRDREGEDMVDGVQDILDVYNQYIAFTIQHHPSSPPHLLPLLESTTRRFVDDVRYSQDVRYLKLWAMYSRNVERREEIWAFLESKDVGTKHASFYEEWATALEGLNRRKRADEIYRIGLARKAAPMDRLKTRHAAFLQRIMAPPSGIVPDDEPAPGLSSSTSHNDRAILGQSGSIPGAAQLAPSNRVSKAMNGAKMAVFIDGEGRGGEDGTPSEWAEFGTREDRRKENVVEATPWKGEVLVQKRAGLAPRTPKMEIFKDSSDNNGSVRVADDFFTREKQPVSEADHLKANPLRHYDTTSLATAVPPALPVIPEPKPSRKPPKPTRSNQLLTGDWVAPDDGQVVVNASGKRERRMFDWNAVYRNGEEYSFEEVRARSLGLMGKEWRGDVKDWEMEWHAPGAITPRKPEKRSVPSPTVNTKLAEQEVLRMFDQTIHGSKIREESDEEDSSDEEDGAPIDAAPTPLPAPRSTMMIPGSAIPPTPTPAQGYRGPGLNIFADENAMPASTSKPKFNIFSETPSKTPLAAQTPAPRVFGVFQEEPAAGVQYTPLSSKSRVPLGGVNVFATPALGDRRPQALRTLSIPEEEEEDAPIQHIVEEVEHVNINDEEDEDDQPPARRVGRFGIHEMTPITERTCEFTTRSSAFGTNSTRRISGFEEKEMIFAGGLGEPLSSVQEEQVERGKPRVSDLSVSTMDENGDRRFSGGVMDDGKFEVPEGFTIQKRVGGGRGMSPTMVVVDRSVLQREKYDGEGSMDGVTETAEFVTAEQPFEERPGDVHRQSLTPLDSPPTAALVPGGVPDEYSEDTLPNPCNPSDEVVINALLSSITPPLSALPGFTDLRTTASNRSDALAKHAKSLLRRSTSNARQSIAPDFMPLDLNGQRFEVRDKIGEGGFGAVFLAVDVAARDAMDDRDDDEVEDEEGEDKTMVAIKVERPGSVWEAVLLDRLHSRLDEYTRRSIINPRNLYAFADESFLLLDYSGQGTLLDIVNKATQMGIAPAVAGAPSAVDELVAIFFTIELLRLLETLHRANFIHGDLKIDNCLVRLEDIPNAQWSTQYSRTGNNGWDKKGIKMIDFGRAIDLSLYPRGEEQTFVGDWKVDERDCVEMREGRSWSWECDYWGMAGVVYCLLFGKYFVTEKDGEGRWRVGTPLKRYWQTALWTKLFDSLLNPHEVREDRSLPISDDLAAVREEFETWLEGNCQKGGKCLRSMLKKIELAAITSRR